MELQTGRAFFAAIQKRAMAISKQQGYPGLAPNSKRAAAMEIWTSYGSPGGDFDAFWSEVHRLGTTPSNSKEALKRREKRNKKQQRADKASPDLVERYIKLIRDGNGSAPLDWLLLREWTDVTSTQLRHARKAAIARGYKHIGDRGDQKLFELPRAAEPAYGAGAPEQATLPLDVIGSDVGVVDLLNDILMIVRDMRDCQLEQLAVWKS